MAGKKGARLPSQLLQQMRLASKDPEPREGDNPFVVKLKEQFRDDFKTFSARLERLETHHKSLSIAGQADAEAAAVGPYNSDEGTDKGMAVIRELMEKKGWRKCPKCGEDVV